MCRNGKFYWLRNLIILAIVVAVLGGLALLINSQYKATDNLMRANDFSLLELKPASDNTSAMPYVVAENEKLQMILDPTSLGVTLVDKATGKRIESTHGSEEDELNVSWKGFLGSGVSIEYFSGNSPNPERADMFNGTPNIIIENIDKGFKANVIYESLEIAFEVIVELTEDGMTARVPASSIYEGEQFKLASIYLYPFMGATRLGEEEGYMLVPDGAGALISLSDNKGRFKAPYVKRVYGENIAIDPEISQELNLPIVREPEEIVMPVFGIAYTNKDLAILGIAEEGKYNSELLAYPNGVTSNYNWITIKYKFREDFITQISRNSGIRSAPKEGDFRDIAVRFILLSGEDANYSGMAKAYRNYLLENDLLVKKDYDFNIRLDFLGAESKEWIIFDKIIPMTTVSQLRTILDDLREEGIEDILPTYMGWQKGGLSLSYGDNSYKLEKALGSMDELMELAKTLKESDIDLMLYLDFLLANPKRNYNTSTDIVKNMSKILAKKLTHKSLYPELYYLTPTRSLENSQIFSSKFKDSSLSGITLGSHPNTLFSYYSRGNIYTREDTKDVIDLMLKGLQDFNIAMQKPFDYMWQYTDYYFDLPVYTSKYNYISQEVPFLPMVLKGYIPYYSSYVNFEPNKNNFFLKMIEYGTYPSFILTWEESSELKDTNSSDIFTSEYDDFRPIIIQYYNELKEIYDKIEGSEFIKHEILDTDVVKVTYSNGVEILINYSDSQFRYGQEEIPPESYRIYEVN